MSDTPDLARLTQAAADAIGGAQRQLPPELRALARGVPVPYERLPAALFLGALFASIYYFFDAPVIGLVVGTAAAFAILVAEVAGGVWLLGRRFEMLDLSAELRS